MQLEVENQLPGLIGCFEPSWTTLSSAKFAETVYVPAGSVTWRNVNVSQSGLPPLTVLPGAGWRAGTVQWVVSPTPHVHDCDPFAPEMLSVAL